MLRGTMLRRWQAPLAWFALAGVVSVGCNAVLGIESGTLGTGGGGAGVGGAGGAIGGGGSGAGPTQCPPIMVPDDCVDGHVDTDEACCAPGRSCQEGTCTQGACSPFRIGFPSAETLDLLLIDDRVYWTTGWGQQIISSKLDGTDQQELFAALEEPDSYVTQMATDGDDIFFTDYGGARIRSVPVGGGAITVVSTVAADPEPPQAEFARIEYADGWVYWGMYTTGGVYRAATDGSTPDAELVAVESALGVAVDATHVYWSDTDGGRVRRLEISEIGSGTPEEVLTDISEPGELLLDGDRIYVLNGDGVRSALKDGEDDDVVLHAPAQNYPWGIAVDDRFIYWTDWDGGEVRRTRKDGQGIVSVMDLGRANLTGLAQDCTTLFFGCTEGVYKITK